MTDMVSLTTNTTPMPAQPATQAAPEAAQQTPPPGLTGKFGPPFIVDISWASHVPDKPADA